MHDTAFRLKEIRKLRGLSQAEFAKTLGVPLRSYQAYEVGEHPFSEDLLKRLAGIGISVQWLLTGDGDMNAPIREEVAQLEALVEYWRANYKLLEANINRVRAQIKDEYGEELAARLCDELLPELDVLVQFPHPTGKAKEIVGLAEEKSKKREA
ncbi:MAG: helix-turn-helix domain-containing protein [Candidatus Neomarinimicrobiota bacterium]